MKQAVLNKRVIETFENLLEDLKKREGSIKNQLPEQEILQIAAQLTVAVMLVEEMESIKTDLGIILESCSA